VVESPPFRLLIQNLRALLIYKGSGTPPSGPSAVDDGEGR